MNNNSAGHQTSLTREQTDRLDQSPAAIDPEQILPSLTAHEREKTQTLNKFGLWQSGTILLLSGFCIFLLSPSGSNWRLNLSNLKASQANQESKPQASFSGNILPVETISVKPVDSYQLLRSYTGSLVTRRSSELGFERSGKLVRLTVDEGDWVKASTPLAYLDTRNLKAQQRELLATLAQQRAQLKELFAGPRSETIAAAQASVRDLSSQLELARKKRSRREALYREGAISREQLDEATSQTSVKQARLEEAKSQVDELLAGTRPERIEAQQASIQQLNARLASLEIELENSILKAPFSGTISGRLLDEGTVVSPGQPILRLVEDGAIQARIGVPVSATDQLQLNSEQSLQIGQKTYPARVSSILPELDSSTRTLTVVLTLDPLAVRQVSPGQVARWKLAETIPTAGYWLPTTALVQGVRGLWSCYVLGELAESDRSGAAHVFSVERRDVEILQTQSNRILVRGTLQAGDQVIVGGTHRLVPGQKVRSKTVAGVKVP
ncbi:efflux RND transporter periplasmic adaptor subunit [Moorena sp. SIO4G3]|uniref:efflux RND transporter periplasmic adaptor subunit n=1 Tax=Moorena sp. SIO4G3 TaxID=2607821 RepID=UPI00142C975C|nr:efflux RND transporter periplasmic adaptor subunit [Moorena sp. SIO4G3]NEO77940.1 efflux RND transporter periplasmic adaptor subunit [Moorena sp. SIO4G3]